MLPAINGVVEELRKRNEATAYFASVCAEDMRRSYFGSLEKAMKMASALSCVTHTCWSVYSRDNVSWWVVPENFMGAP